MFAIKRDPNNRWFLKGQLYLNTIRPGRVSHFEQMLSAGTISAAQRNSLLMALDYATHFSNHSAYLPDKEDNIIHNNEADVVRTAILYLIHPVAQALWACPDYFRSFSSQSEDFEHQTRTGLTFFKVAQPSAAQNSPARARDFAVVEFKRRGWIKGEEFSHDHTLRVPAAHAQNSHQFFQQILTPFAPNVPNTQAQHQAWLSAQQAFNDVVTENGLTEHCFSSNPLNHIKQAAAYSIIHRTRYVALFNYDYLVLCYFPWLDIEKSKTTLRANNQAQQNYPVETDVYPMSVIDPQTQTKQLNPEVRLALLGFLQAGYENAP